MRQFTRAIDVRTDGKGLYNVTRQIELWVRECGLETGLLTVFLQHTSASLTVQENADPDVVLDLADFFEKLVPDNPRLYRHTIEGPDDMPAHIRAALTMTQLSIPLVNGELALGTWQGIYVFEHRAATHRRRMILHLIGEVA
ncbi:MAG: secondary thiamine-phosphate synthase enzyme YjbQ [Bryobacteraceae bacterium]|nr:secondary thiamine-phosphate synthase enzyme YjbQ [Bryobacteraceae bacterium]